VLKYQAELRRVTTDLMFVADPVEKDALRATLQHIFACLWFCNLSKSRARIIYLFIYLFIWAAFIAIWASARAC
jgi:hypothetical protein